MFDAINSIERDYQRYRVQVPANPAASAEAAAAQAAHDVLVALIPAAEGTFDTALQGRLATIHSWRAAQGVAVGKKVARAILDWRTGDGSEQPNIPYLPPALPGLWQPAVPGQVAAFVQFGNVETFAAADAHAVPAGSAAHAEQRRVRRGSQSSEGFRIDQQRQLEPQIRRW